MRIIQDDISLADIQTLALGAYEDMVKGVVDINKAVIALGPELHVDAEQVLLSQGSKQADLWGFNIYPDEDKSDWIEYDSMINIRPNQGNRSRYVEDESIRKRILEIMESKIK
ncbi:MAG: hypothetical protein HOA17_03360 [Candidatus Melainabacteria bacterium]|nr:hypothetical protein [Candidatus Melainabacteria bacterium]